MNGTTPQFDILTKMVSRARRDGTVTPNPFYGAKKDEIEKNLSYATEVYADVFRQYVSAWFMVGGHKESAPPKSWESLAI